jgi:hypothetical protein
MWGIGLFMAVVGPLFLLPVVWVVHRWPLGALDRWRELRTGRRLGWKRQAMAFGLVGAGVLATWMPGYLRYAALCDTHATPVVVERVTVDGFFVTQMFAYEAERYLSEWGFRWVEAPDPYRPGRILRYAKDPTGATGTTEIPSPTAGYAYLPGFSEEGGGLSLSTKRIVRLPDAEAWRDPVGRGVELARAGSVTYHGGPLRLLLGAWGMTNCPTPRTESGSGQFMQFYELERRVLRAG